MIEQMLIGKVLVQRGEVEPRKVLEEKEVSKMGTYRVEGLERGWTWAVEDEVCEFGVVEPIGVAEAAPGLEEREEDEGDGEDEKY